MSTKKQYTTSDFVEYHVTGLDRAGKRFKMVYSDYFTAKCINVWQGTLFGILPEGGRIVLRRYWN